jgi:hypothetical protein
LNTSPRNNETICPSADIDDTDAGGLICEWSPNGRANDDRESRFLQRFPFAKEKYSKIVDPALKFLPDTTLDELSLRACHLPCVNCIRTTRVKEVATLVLREQLRRRRLEIGESPLAADKIRKIKFASRAAAAFLKFLR